MPVDTETQIENTDQDLFNYSILDKMGFELKQLAAIIWCVNKQHSLMILFIK